MTLREYKETLDMVADKYPEYLDLPVVYSVDFAGTKFNLVRTFPFAVSNWVVDGNKLESVCIN